MLSGLDFKAAADSIACTFYFCWIICFVKMTWAVCVSKCGSFERLATPSLVPRLPPVHGEKPGYEASHPLLFMRLWYNSSVNIWIRYTQVGLSNDVKIAHAHTSSWMLGSAPFDTSTWTTLRCPSQLARARAVLPSCSMKMSCKSLHIFAKCMLPISIFYCLERLYNIHL